MRRIRRRKPVSKSREEDRGRDENQAGNRSYFIWNSADGKNEGRTDKDDVEQVGTSSGFRWNQIDPYEDVSLE